MKCPACKKHDAIDGGLCYECLPFNLYAIPPVVTNEDLRRLMLARKGDLENMNFAQIQLPRNHKMQDLLRRSDQVTSLEAIAVGDFIMLPFTDQNGYRSVALSRMKATEWMSDGQHRWGRT